MAERTTRQDIATPPGTAAPPRTSTRAPLGGMPAAMGNAAFTRIIARDGMGAGSEPYADAPVEQVRADFKRQFTDVAKRAVDHPLHPLLCEHYAYGGGKPLTLNVDQMRQVPLMTPSGQMDVFVTSMGGMATAMQQLWNELRAAAGSETSAQRSIDVTSGGTLPSRKPLGTFTCNLRGTLTGTTDGGLDEHDAPRATFEFDGAMTWRDVWDFDSHLIEHAKTQVLGQKWNGRPWPADITTWVGSWLPGVKYVIDTPEVPITQRKGAPAAW